MSFSSLVNASLTVKRSGRVGREDGTPVFAETDLAMRGWFDEQALQNLNMIDRSGGVGTSERRALLLLESEDILRPDDEVVVVLDSVLGVGLGASMGRWRVDIIRTAADPTGSPHWEAILSFVEESG